MKKFYILFIIFFLLTTICYAQQNINTNTNNVYINGDLLKNNQQIDTIPKSEKGLGLYKQEQYSKGFHAGLDDFRKNRQNNYRQYDLQPDFQNGYIDGYKKTNDEIRLQVKRDKQLQAIIEAEKIRQLEILKNKKLHRISGFILFFSVVLLIFFIKYSGDLSIIFFLISIVSSIIFLFSGIATLQ